MDASYEAQERFTSTMRFLIRLTLALFLLVYSAPAFSGQCEIEVGPGWMRGKADGISLGKVLTEVTKKTGCPIYIDEQLQEIPVSFNIPDKLVPEKFIKRIVRPHSYAMVFGSEDEENVSTIHEVWVFRKGHQFTTTYIDLTGASTGGSTTVSSLSTPASGGPNISGGGSSAGAKKFVKRRLHVKKNAYGGSFFTHEDPNKGPDYRMTPNERQEAYWKYRAQKKQCEQRIANGMLSRARKESRDARNTYWARRNQEIRQQILDLKNSKNKEEEE